MADYQEYLGIAGLAEEADDGAGVKIAILDTGDPNLCFHTDPCDEFENFTGDYPWVSSHASAVGSLLVADTRELRGVCPKARVFFGKVFDGGTAKVETIVKGIKRAVEWGADIVNMSFGIPGEFPPELAEACQEAYDKGVILTAASGNSNSSTMYPAALSTVISVGASDSRKKEEFSNYGKVDFTAPGVDLPCLDTTGGLVTRTGTSFSAPLITGILALILAGRRKRGLPDDPESVKADLIARCRDIAEEGYDSETGYGFPFVIGDVESRTELPVMTLCDKIKDVIGKIVSIFKRR